MAIHIVPFVAVVCASFAFAQDEQRPQHRERVTRASVSVTLAETDHYPLDVCIVAGKPLTKDSVECKAGARTFKVVDADAKATIEKDPEPWVAKLDAAAIAAQAPWCDTKVCLGCRKAFAANAKPVDRVVEGTLLRLCTGPLCKEPSRPRLQVSMTTLRGHLAQRTNQPYAAKSCPVCDKELGDKAIWVRHGWALVRLCCDECLPAMKVTPNAFVTKALGAPPATADTPDGAASQQGKPGEKAPKEQAAEPKKAAGEAEARKKDGGD